MLVNKMNVFRTNIHFGLCTTSPDHVSDRERGGASRPGAKEKETNHSNDRRGAEARANRTQHKPAQASPRTHSSPGRGRKEGNKEGEKARGSGGKAFGQGRGEQREDREGTGREEMKR